MSEEILKALTQLFAIISKQDDGVTEAERQFVIRFFQQELDQDSIKEYVEYFDQVSGYNHEGEDTGKLTSVKDSVRTLGICRKINKTLTQKQKVIVLIRLLEMVGSGNHFTAQAIEIISTVSSVFNISGQDYKLIEMFVTATGEPLNSPDLRVIPTQHQSSRPDEHDLQPGGQLIFMAIRSVSTYFVKFVGSGSNLLNGFIMQPGRVYLLSHGSSVKTTSGDAVFYSDLVAHFNQDLNAVRLSFQANIEEFNFNNGAPGLRNVVIAEGPGKLIGIMGASGAGKTTLLNVLAGLEKPGKGEIVINGLNVHTEKEKLHGVVGYVAQDDLLVEELTVYQNLYFNARLCLAGCEEAELCKRVMETLTNLGLDQRKDLKVGNALEKTISGGQRKRLNIALELIREPAILFLDEPTSGLSSRDSENVIDLLKELSLKGKLIFVVIHQPSSDIFKMFDKMIIMDTGGLPVYYGSPVEAVSYFKKGTHQVDSNRGQCEVCGNVNPEQIFNIIEAKVVDEYGQSTSKRKVTPQQWNMMYESTFRIPRTEEVNEHPV
ncbi:MAG: ATP-binding cassette domain-containing protein, partial [Bacteroidota bacterium]|nr:ATP-binding cassette domain-containing protein [Bacteroidota bacterium]